MERIFDFGSNGCGFESCQARQKKKKREEITLITQIKRKNDYEFFDKFTAGIVLLGDEVKSVQKHQVVINNSFIVPINNELFIVNMLISNYCNASQFSQRRHDSKRKRKLLLKKDEILKIINQSRIKKYIIVPLRILIKKGWVKVEIALAKRLKKYQIKEKEKEKEIKKRLKKNDWEED